MELTSRNINIPSMVQFIRNTRAEIGYFGDKYKISVTNSGSLNLTVQWIVRYWRKLIIYILDLCVSRNHLYFLVNLMGFMISV
jgi:hypothetical protein